MNRFPGLGPVLQRKLVSGASLEVKVLAVDNSKTMVNWNCCSALCSNNHRKSLPDGSKIKKYRLSRNPEIQQQYKSILKTDGINFKDEFICAQHWSKGFRESTDDLPGAPVPASQLLELKEFG